MNDSDDQALLSGGGAYNKQLEKDDETTAYRECLNAQPDLDHQNYHITRRARKTLNSTNKKRMYDNCKRGYLVINECFVSWLGEVKIDTNRPANL